MSDSFPTVRQSDSPTVRQSDSVRQLSDSSDRDSSEETLVYHFDSSDSSDSAPTAPTAPRQHCSNASLASFGLFFCNSTVCMHPWNQDGQCSVHAEVDVNLTVATMIAVAKIRCAVQILKSRVSLLHSILRQKYRVERLPEGSPTSSLCILQVSEAECQGIKSYACLSASMLGRTNVDDGRRRYHQA